MIAVVCSRASIATFVLGLLITVNSCTDENPLSAEGERGPLVPAFELPDTYDLDSDGLSDRLEESLLRQYRPYWEFDGQEAIWPISVTNWADLGNYVLGPQEQRSYYSNLTTLYDAVTEPPYQAFGDMFTEEVYFTSDPDSNAPTYVDAQDLPNSFCIGPRCNLVWLHYWLFWQQDRKNYPVGTFSHYGDWEHMCLLVEENSEGDDNRTPVAFHWHHHGDADITATSGPWSYESDSWGNKHPVAFVEALAHGIYRNPDSSFHDGGGSSDNPLDNPLVFMTSHWSNRSSGQLENEVIEFFEGDWGQSGGSPAGPTIFGSKCDHDYVPNPVGSDWAQSGC